MRTDYWQKLEEGGIYHIYNRAVGKDDLFSNDGNYQFFLNQWKKYLPYLDVFCYCLIPNHFHFLAKVKPLSEPLLEHIKSQATVKSSKFIKQEIPYHEYLEDQFKRLFGSYALAYNKQHDRTGTLFQKRFKRILVGDDYKLLYLLAYIHHNPIHHKLYNAYGLWLHCSWNAYLNLDKQSLLDRSEVLRWFGTDLEAAKAAFFKHHENFKEDWKMRDDCMEDV